MHGGSAHLAEDYSPYCLEEEFCELRLFKILRRLEVHAVFLS
jgi:hypothetical protein